MAFIKSLSAACPVRAKKCNEEQMRSSFSNAYLYANGTEYIRAGLFILLSGSLWELSNDPRALGVVKVIGSPLGGAEGALPLPFSSLLLLYLSPGSPRNPRAFPHDRGLSADSFELG